MRNRWLYSLVIGIVILLGLPTRMDILPLPYVVLKYGGGFLWAGMIYLILGWLFPNARIHTLWIAAILISCGNEFGQLYHNEALDAFRTTIIGRLTIGRGFLWEDMISYIAGVSTAAFVERRWLIRQPPQSNSNETGEITTISPASGRS